MKDEKGEKYYRTFFNQCIEFCILFFAVESINNHYLFNSIKKKDFMCLMLSNALSFFYRIKKDNILKMLKLTLYTYYLFSKELFMCFNRNNGIHTRRCYSRRITDN
jgi:hypothetical protein